MKYYQEITLIPDVEISPYFIWSKLYNQLHISLVDVKNKHGIDTIGVSFPNYRYEEKGDKTFATLGAKLRVFARSEEELNTLNLSQRISRLSDYLHIKNAMVVGEKVTGYLQVQRYRYKNIERQAQTFAAFKNISYDEALAHCKAYKLGSRKHYPFVNLLSQDTGQKFQLSIKQEIRDNLVEGEFNTYGFPLDGGATVPHW